MAIEWRLNGVAVPPGASGQWTFSPLLTQLPNGTHLVASVDVDTGYGEQSLFTSWFLIDNQQPRCGPECKLHYLQNMQPNTSTLQSVDVFLTGLFLSYQVPVTSATWSLTVVRGPSASSSPATGSTPVTTSGLQYTLRMAGLRFVSGDVLALSMELTLASGVETAAITDQLVVSASDTVTRGRVVNNGGPGGCTSPNTSHVSMQASPSSLQLCWTPFQRIPNDTQCTVSLRHVVSGAVTVAPASDRFVLPSVPCAAGVVTTAGLPGFLLPFGVYVADIVADVAVTPVTS